MTGCCDGRLAVQWEARQWDICQWWKWKQVEFNPPGERDNTRSHAIPCDLMRSHEIACDRMRSHVIACDRMKSQTLCRQLSEFLKMHREREAGQKVCSKVFLHDNCEQISYNFFRFLKKEEIRSGTHFTQRNVFLLFTVVVTYFQSRFPKRSSKRVSS